MAVQQASTLQVDTSFGLTEAEVEESRRRHGSNAFSPIPTKSAWEFFREAFADPMLRILLACAAVSLTLGAVGGDLVDGVAIMAAVLVVTAVGTYNQVRAERDFSALDAVSRRERVRVVREGRVVEIDAEELVKGDVIEVNTGDVVPADARFVKGAELLVNEAHITGEPDTTKQVGADLFGSSRVLDGSGQAVVTGVGDDSVFGRVRQEIGERGKETPLEERLGGLASTIGKVGTWAAVGTFLALLGSGLVRDQVEPALDLQFLTFVLGAMTIAITIVVVAVPEGLPLAVTLSLAYTTRKMARDKALVRDLAACETMGAATVVCSDKTGTLTHGAMTLASAELGDRSWTCEELGTVLAEAGGGDALPSLVEGIAVNSTADLVERDGELAVVGNSTEGALLRWLTDHGLNYRQLRERARVVMRREFNSSRKHMLTVVADGHDWRVHLKGAPEVVLDRCDRVATADGARPLDGPRLERILEVVREHARRGNRTLAFATATVPAGSDQDQLDQRLVFGGLFVIADPIRDEVSGAVERCRRADVRVMIVTGDIRETAQEVGRQAGIVGPGALVLEGGEFRAMTDEQVTGQLDQIAVLARALPEDKKRMVELLQSRGDVVAVTGDGVNDAPALVTADVGFSMGSGSKVAREASDIVIVDDNFVSLVGAIRWGRSVFENIRKFLQFQLTVNVVALATALIAALAGFGTPLTAVQLLWVNLIMDSLAALALALEPPSDRLFDQPPHGREEPLISRSMWANVLSVGLYMFGLLLLVLLTGTFVDQGRDDGYRATFLFNTFVWLQIWNEVNCRSTRFHHSPFAGLWRSRSFLAVAGIIVVVQVLIIQVGGAVFSTTPLSLGDWVLSVLLGASVLPFAALVRLVGRARAGRGPAAAGAR